MAGAVYIARMAYGDRGSCFGDGGGRAIVGEVELLQRRSITF